MCTDFINLGDGKILRFFLKDKVQWDEKTQLKNFFAEQSSSDLSLPPVRDKNDSNSAESGSLVSHLTPEKLRSYIALIRLSWLVQTANRSSNLGALSAFLDLLETDDSVQFQKVWGECGSNLISCPIVVFSDVIVAAQNHGILSEEKAKELVAYLNEMVEEDIRNKRGKISSPSVRMLPNKPIAPHDERNKGTNEIS